MDWKPIFHLPEEIHQHVVVALNHVNKVKDVGQLIRDIAQYTAYNSATTRDGNEAGILRPRRGPAQHQRKIPAPDGNGDRDQSPSGDGDGDEDIFSPLPHPRFGRYLHLHPHFSVLGWEKIFILVFLSNFSWIILCIVKVVLHKLVKI